MYLGRRVVILLYDRYARRYERIKGYDPALEAYFLGRPLMIALAPHSAPLVLDVATGTARLPRALIQQAQFEGCIIGLDLSRRMLHYGAGRVAQALHEERVHLMHSPAEKLPFEDASFDLVTCLEALEFMSAPKGVIAELIRVTRPGGLLLLTNRRGRDAKLMPGKAWSREQAEAIYRDEFGLETVMIATWQYDYDLVWARKSGHNPPHPLPNLTEVWRCPKCNQTQMQHKPDESRYHCGACGTGVKIGRDGVIEIGV